MAADDTAVVCGLDIQVDIGEGHAIFSPKMEQVRL